MATECIAQVAFKFDPQGKPVVAAFDVSRPVPMAARTRGITPCSGRGSKWTCRSAVQFMKDFQNWLS